jgi:hypothetical protein
VKFSFWIFHDDHRQGFCAQVMRLWEEVNPKPVDQHGGKDRSSVKTLLFR